MFSLQIPHLPCSTFNYPIYCVHPSVTPSIMFRLQLHHPLYSAYNYPIHNVQPSFTPFIMFSLQLPGSLCSAYKYPIHYVQLTITPSTGRSGTQRRTLSSGTPDLSLTTASVLSKLRSILPDSLSVKVSCVLRKREGGRESCVCACVRACMLACVNSCVCAVLCKLVGVAVGEKMCLSGGRLHVGIILSIIMCSQSPVSCFVIYELVNG